MKVVVISGSNSNLKLPSLKLYTFVSFVSFFMLIFLYAHPAAKETFQYREEIHDLLKKVEDEDANLEDQTIHWFAAVICVNMGKLIRKRMSCNGTYRQKMK